MKTAIKYIIILTIITIVSSCNHSNTLGKMIPKDAFLIVHVDGKSLSSKIKFEDLKNSTWFNKINSDSNTEVWMKTYLQNPDASGIDSHGDMIIFFQKNSNTNSNIVIEGDIKDLKNFESFTKNFSTGNASKDGGLNVSTLRNNGAATWNDKKFVFVFNKEFTYLKDSTLAKHAGFSGPMDLVTYSKGLFNLKEDSSMKNNDHFTTLLNQGGDLHIWQNNEEIIKDAPLPGAIGMLKLDVFIKNNVAASTVNFEDGKIDVKNSWYGSKELMDVLAKNGGGTIDNQMVKNIPSQDITALISLHFKPQGIQELLKLTGMDGLVNIFISQQGFNLDDFVAANKGDILLVASDFKVKKDSTNDSSKSYHPTLNFLFASSIGDKKSFDKLVLGGKKISDKMKKDSGISYAMNDQFFVLGNDLNTVNKYKTGANNTFTFFDDIKDHPIAGFVDLNKILSAIGASNIKDTMHTKVLNASAKMWDRITFSGGNFADGAMQLHGVVALMDKKTNSLKQLNNYMDVLSTMVHHKIWHKQFGKDSTINEKGYMDSSMQK